MCKFSIVFTAAGLFINLAGMFFFFIVILTPFFVCMHFFFWKMRQNVKNEEKTREKKIVSCLHANTKLYARNPFLKSYGIIFV